jgi:hypothetical protein
MLQEQKIIKVSEEQRGEWTETRWSDGRVTMHRPSTKTTLNPRGGNRETGL